PIRFCAPHSRWPLAPRGQRLTQRAVNLVEPAICMEWRWQRHERGDFASGSVVLIAQGDEQLVARAQRRNRRGEVLQDLLLVQRFIGGGTTVRQLIEDLGIVCQLDQTVRHGQLSQSWRWGAAVLLPIMVQTEAADNHDERSSELSLSICG